MQKDHNSIPEWAWCLGGNYGIWSYDLSSAGTIHTGLLSQAHTGPIQIAFEFREQLPEGIVLILQADTPRSWKCNGKHEISLM